MDIQNKKKTSFDKQLEEVTYNCFQYLKNIKKLSCQTSIEDVLFQVETLLTFLPGPLTIQKLIKIDATSYELYVENCYISLIEQLIRLFDHSFPLKQEYLYEPIKNLFTIEDPFFFKANLETLVNYLKIEDENLSRTIVILLQILLSSDGYFACIFHYTFDITFQDTFVKEDKSASWNNCLRIIVSLPSRVANTLKGNGPIFFFPKNYTKFLIINVIKVIEFISCFLKFKQENENYINYQNIASLLSKIIINFNDGLNSEPLIDFVEIIAVLTNESSDKRRLYQRIFRRICESLDKPSIEILAKLFLLKIDPKKFSLNEILGKNLINNESWKFVLCTKIPLLNYFEKDYSNLIVNLVVYLSYASQSDLIKLFINLLTVWADRSSINHISVGQHIFVSKIIVCIANSLKNSVLNDGEISKINKIVFSGMSVHLESSIEMIRSTGMKTGEIVINFLNKEMEDKNEMELKFDYDNLKTESKDTVHELQRIFDEDLQIYFKIKEVPHTYTHNLLEKLSIKANQNIEYIPPERKLKPVSYPREQKNEVILVESFKPKRSHIKIIDSTDFKLDSDDDLEPYDLSNDIKVLRKRPPAYLRDLRDGLLEAEDHELFVLCLENCEKIIITQLPDDDASIGLEILEIIISLEPRFYVEDFDSLVFQSCIAITCVYPAFYAEYLCKQVHANLGTYSISRRVFMMDVLRQAAKTLSALKKDKETGTEVTRRKIKELDSAKVISKRLESKTRYFKKHKYFKLEKLNKFGDVAGHFFFPLLYGFNQNQMLCQSVKEDDHILLIHFIETLAIIMCASENCLIAPRMAREIFNFSWYLRFHKDVKIRMGILSLISSAVLSVPQCILIQDFINELFEIRLWLTDLLNPVRGEVNRECRSLVVCVMVLIEGVLKLDVEVGDET